MAEKKDAKTIKSIPSSEKTQVTHLNEKHEPTHVITRKADGSLNFYLYKINNDGTFTRVGGSQPNPRNFDDVIAKANM